MNQPNAKPGGPLSDVLTAAHGRAETDEGKKISYGDLARWVIDNHRVGTTDETIRAYHQGTGGEKRNPLLVAALADRYGLKLSDLPVEEAERIKQALKVLKSVAGRGTPPGTRTRNLQNTGQRNHPSSPSFEPDVDLVEAEIAERSKVPTAA